MCLSSLSEVKRLIVQLEDRSTDYLWSIINDTDKPEALRTAALTVLNKRSRGED